MKSFEKFIEKKYPGLNFISISSEDYIPGVIVNDDDRIIDSLQNVFRTEPSQRWGTKRIAAEIADETIHGERNLSISGKVIGLFQLKAGVTAAYTVSFEFNKCTEHVFDSANGAIYENDARRMIDKLKDTDKETWKSLLHNFVTMCAVYIEEVTIQFKRDGAVVLEADIEKLKQEVSIGSDYKWSAAGKMVFSNNKVPFGVMGFPIKRMM